MASVHDVAAYILARGTRPMSTSKLHRLVYLADGWSFAVTGVELFPEVFTVRRVIVSSMELLAEHPGVYEVWTHRAGNAEALTDAERTVVDGVVRQYDRLSGHDLTRLVREARLPGWGPGRVVGAQVPKAEMSAAFTVMLMPAAA